MIIYLFMFLFLLCLYLLIKKNNYENFENENYTAIIIEPRKHKALEFVLNNFIQNLDKKWNIIIFHGNKNIDYIHNILKNNNNRNIKLINLNVDNLTIKDYNKLLTSKNFYNYIPTEIFLIFQTDTMICDKYKDKINDFLNYDYTGAPLKAKLVGNGGLSLRRKSKILEILEKCPYKDEPEDVYFSVACNQIPLYKPNYDEAKKFSVEEIYNDESFGVHKPWAFLNKNLISRKNGFCNGLDQLIELNKK